jgi:hypothetical protein
MVQTRNRAAGRGGQRLMRADELPQVRRAGPIPSRARVQHRCQDRPPRRALPSTYEQILPAVQRDADERARRQCKVPRDGGVSHKRCEGWRLGYPAAQSPNHGPDFYVCVHCSRRNWDTHGWTKDPCGVDLCRRCSLRVRRENHPGDGRNECLCRMDRVDKNIHLCTDCRIEQRQREHRRATQWIRQQTLLGHIHTAPDDNCTRENCTDIDHFIQPDGGRVGGESGCLCGSGALDKVATYIKNGTPNLRRMVRMCVHCQREAYIAMRAG